MCAHKIFNVVQHNLARHVSYGKRFHRNRLYQSGTCVVGHFVGAVLFKAESLFEQ